MNKIITTIMSLLFASQSVVAYSNFSTPVSNDILTTTVRDAYYEEFGYSESEIENSSVKPKLTVSKLVIPESKKNNIQRVEISVEGADYKYSNTQLHVFYDERLSISWDRYGELSVKGAQKDLSYGTPIDASKIGEEYGMSCVVLYTTPKTDVIGNKGKNGVLWTIDFELPYNAQAGDIFPIDIQYYSSTTTNDYFYNSQRDYDCELMNAYVFTKGIYNSYNPYEGDEYLPKGSTYDGYIAIESAPEITTSTTTSTTVTSTSTTTTTSTSTMTSTSTSTTTTTTATSTSTTTIPAVTTTVTGIHNTNLQYVQYNDHVEITGSKKDFNGDMVIPETINDLPVTKINDRAFNNSYIKSISIPNSVIVIGNNAFSSCRYLTNVTIPESVNKIGSEAFRYCSSLKYIKVLNPDCEFYDDWDVIPNNATIYGYIGSTAETYAATYGYSFANIYSFSEALYTTTTTTKRTTNLKTTTRKSTTTTTAVTTPVTEPSPKRLFGDVNGDNVVDASDASCILSYYAYMSTGGTGLLEDYLKNQNIT